VLQWYHSGVTMVSQWCYIGVTVVDHHPVYRGVIVDSWGVTRVSTQA
jgi:hypothetical protein